MGKKYRLLPVQVENLQKMCDENFSKLRKLNIIKTEDLNDKKAASGREMNLGVDSSLLGILTVTIKNYKEAKEKLENYEIVEPSNSDIIELGSTFEVQMNYDGFEENEIFTLVETHIPNDDKSFISVDSPLGKAVVGAKAGEEISYTVEQRRITGTVTDIIKEQKTL